MNRSLLLCLLVILVAGVVAAEESYSYLHVKPVFEVGNQWVTGSSSGGCWIGRREYCSGIVWAEVDTKRSGIRVGSVVRRHEGHAFELLYSFTILHEPDALLLVGSIYGIELDSSGMIIGGRKKIVQTEAITGQPTVINAGFLPDGTSINLEVTIDPPREKIAERTTKQPLELISTLFQEGTVVSHRASSWNSISLSRLIKAPFSIWRDDFGSIEINYQIEVIFSQALDKIKTSTECDLRIVRTYSLDTLKTSRADFVEDLAYRSELYRRIVLTPGEELRIVVPPDTPSIHGFDIEDTLIIRP